MEKKSLVEEIIRLEWPMFREVNGDERADCQKNYPMFVAMRGAQFAAWDEASLLSYRGDLEAAVLAGRNLLRDKYIHMMETTEPEHYAHFRRELPPVSQRKRDLAAAIWEILLPQTVEFRQKYPAIARLGRPLLASQERNGYASVETYEKGELLTYSEETLEKLLRHIRAQAERGISFAAEIQERGLRNQGYDSPEEAEEDARRY